MFKVQSLLQQKKIHVFWVTWVWTLPSLNSLFCSATWLEACRTKRHAVSAWSIKLVQSTGTEFVFRKNNRWSIVCVPQQPPNLLSTSEGESVGLYCQHDLFWSRHWQLGCKWEFYNNPFSRATAKISPKNRTRAGMEWVRGFVEHIQPEVDLWEAMWEARRAEIVADLYDLCGGDRDGAG